MPLAATRSFRPLSTYWRAGTHIVNSQMSLKPTTKRMSVKPSTKKRTLRMHRLFERRRHECARLDQHRFERGDVIRERPPAAAGPRRLAPRAQPRRIDQTVLDRTI